MREGGVCGRVEGVPLDSRHELAGHVEAENGAPLPAVLGELAEVQLGDGREVRAESVAPRSPAGPVSRVQGHSTGREEVRHEARLGGIPHFNGKLPLS